MRFTTTYKGKGCQINRKIKNNMKTHENKTCFMFIYCHVDLL